jgi:hypothetical protein
MRLIDADALAKDLEHDIELDSRALDCTDFVGVERERTLFDKICKQNCVWYLTESPTIYAVPVVRCRECKWSDWYSTKDGNRYCYCMETGIGGRTEDDYCSYAEREDGADNG